MKKLHIHVGLPKTGTTFLQEVVFPETSFCYLGKNSDLSRRGALNCDPFMFFKYLENENSAFSFAEMRVANDKIEQLVRHYNYYHEMIRDKQMLLISDEAFTGNPLNTFMKNILRQCNQRIRGARNREASFARGVSLAEFLIDTQDNESLKTKQQLLSGNLISLKIQRCLDSLGAELGSILLVDRDFGSWFTSFFLQFVKVERYGLGFLKGMLSPDLLFAAAGFVIRWDYFLKDIGRPGLALSSSFSRCIERDFGPGVLSIVQYSSCPSVFAENLKPILAGYGVNPASCDKVRRIEIGKNVTHPGQFVFQGEADIFFLKSEFSRELNALVQLFQ